LGAEDHDPVFADLCHRNCNRAAHKPCLLQSPADVVGISLLSACTFRLRKKADSGWERTSIELNPRSAYLLQGEVRREWEHSIPAVTKLRYSITFRNFRA
jgi:alkylated DNA repair dioxygenase AlkB